MDALYDDRIFPNETMKNNASIVSVIEFAGRRFLFGGDMEKIGWEWLIANNVDFRIDMLNGIDVLIAAHHGHKSGYSSSLMNLIGRSRLTILSKGSEAGSQTDVDSRYSSESDGLVFWEIFDRRFIRVKRLSTRSDGNIIFRIFDDELRYCKGDLYVFTKC